MDDETVHGWLVAAIVIAVIVAAYILPLMLNLATLPGIVAKGTGSGRPGQATVSTPPQASLPATPLPTGTLSVMTAPHSPPATTPPPGSIPSQSPGMLAWYTFDDDFLSSGIVPDLSGHGLDARVTGGSVGQAPGISGGKSASLTGTGYLRAAANPAANRNNVTISLWFRTDNPDANYKIASAARWGGSTNPSNSGWVIGTHVPEFWSDDGIQGTLVPAQPNLPNNFAAGRWNFEVITYDGSRIKEYTNGRLINDWESRGVPLGSGEPLAIGAWPQVGFGFNGQVDDFRIYDRSLTAGEIENLYAQNRP